MYAAHSRHPNVLAKDVLRAGLIPISRACCLGTPDISSSLKITGYGTSSLCKDVEELDELLAYLCSVKHSPHVPAEIILVGHSTGCQDAVFYMAHGSPELRACVRGVVLQAPVSDREFRATLPETEGFVRQARALAPGALMPIEADEVPITAERFLFLTTKVSVCG